MAFPRSLCSSARQTTALLRRSILSPACRSFHQSPVSNATEGEQDKPKKKGRPPKNPSPKPNVQKPAVKKGETKKEERKPIPKISFNYNRPDIPYLDLPPMDEWKQTFKDVVTPKIRPTLRNPDTAMMLAEQFIPEGSRDKIVIEASSGRSYLLSFALYSRL